MVKDQIQHLKNYFSLDERLKNLMAYRGENVSRYASFKVDVNATEIFVVEKGKCSFATSWRENRDNREVTAVMTAEEGEFVLFLPGEPIAATPSDDAIVVRRKLQ